MKKKEILIIFVLISGVVLVSGWWILSGQKVSNKEIPGKPDITVVPKELTCQDREKRQAEALSLSCKQFRILSESVTQFAIKNYYPSFGEDFPIIWNIPSQEADLIPKGCILVKATFRVKLPSDSITVFFCGDRVYFLSFNPGSPV